MARAMPATELDAFWQVEPLFTHSVPTWWDGDDDDDDDNDDDDDDDNDDNDDNWLDEYRRFYSSSGRPQLGRWICKPANSDQIWNVKVIMSELIL